MRGGSGTVGIEEECQKAKEGERMKTKRKKGKEVVCAHRTKMESRVFSFFNIIGLFLRVSDSLTERRRQRDRQSKREREKKEERKTSKTLQTAEDNIRGVKN